MTRPVSARDTCAAWKAEKQRVDEASGALPDGWYWNAATTRTSIVAFTAAVGSELDAFERQLGETPADVVRAARAYLSAKRAELSALTTRTYNQQIGAAVTAARTTLTDLCRQDHPAVGT